METTTINNKTTFIRCPKDTEHPFIRISAKLYSLNGYQFAIMAHILSNKDGWNLVKYEILKRLGFPERKFLKAWKELEEKGYIKIVRRWGGYHYTIFEDPDCTTGRCAICDKHTTGSSTRCTYAEQTTIKNNYYYNNTTTGTDANSYDDEFNELLALYPASSSWNNGITVPLKKNIQKCKDLYIELLNGGIVSHKEIITCLKAELQERVRTGSQQYQPSLLKWLNESGWEIYKEIVLQPVSETYGTQLV